MLDLWAHEKKVYSLGFGNIAGVDEAGRGALAGPVVSAAVILPRHSGLFSAIDDSKRLSVAMRERLFDLIYTFSIAVGVGVVDAHTIDRINVLNASLASMRIAVQNLFPRPDYLLVDGVFEVPIGISQCAIIKGDSLSVSVGSASIVAKVTRDRLMSQADVICPEFGFARHKGYATKFHKRSIERFGYCHMHRRTFKGVREFCTS